MIETLSKTNIISEDKISNWHFFYSLEILILNVSVLNMKVS